MASAVEQETAACAIVGRLGSSGKQRTKHRSRKVGRQVGRHVRTHTRTHTNTHTHLSKGRGDCGEEVVVDVEWGDVWHGSEELRRAPGVEGAEEVLLRAENTELLKLVVRVM